jgi:predicted MFS family arabinose efflux permease
MLHVSVFRNRRFSAASASVTFVYFALMGVMYFLTTYLQSVLGFSALEAGLRMLAIAVGMIIAARVSVGLTRRLGTKVSVASGMAIVAAGLIMVSGLGVEATDGHIAVVLAMLGFGVGLAMSPATEAIMGSLPAAKAGIGSAMNDVVREVAGALAIAVLGSVLASAYASSMEGPTTGMPADSAAAASDSVGAAQQVAAGIGGSAGTDLVTAANQAFVDAMSITASIAAVIAVVGALIAAAFLPARSRGKAVLSGADALEPAAA